MDGHRGGRRGRGGGGEREEKEGRKKINCGEHPEDPTRMRPSGASRTSQFYVINHSTQYRTLAFARHMTSSGSEVASFITESDREARIAALV